MPLKASIFGMGGFARLHHEVLSALESEGSVQLVATCEPKPEAFPERMAQYQASGVKIYRDYRMLLAAHAHELDFASIATPIPLHAPMHRACVEQGVAVYLEKPPTLDWRELEAMIEVEKSARFLAQVGFNFIGEEARQHLKARLVAGEFGTLRRANFLGFWPRPVAYFQRAHWSGKLRAGGHLILDSCVGNALAHYVHNLLFWCGTGEVSSWGEVQEVEAELYRAHAIESFDTVFARGHCGGAQIRVGATHAGSGTAWQHEWLECDNARISYRTRGGGWTIDWTDGRRETGSTDDVSTGEFLTRNLRHFIGYLNGEQLRPRTTLADSRPFVHFNDLLFVAARRITSLGEPFVHRTIGAQGEELLPIQNIEFLLEEFAHSGLLPSESGVTWGRTGGHATAAEIEHLEHVVNDLLTPSILKAKRAHS